MENKLDDDVGPCQRSIDKTLKDLGVERQAYFGGCIIGNHCDKLLIDINVDRLVMFFSSTHCYSICWR